MQINKINIVCAFYLPHIGGVEKYVSHQAKELQKLGFKVDIITSNSEKAGFKEDLGDLRIYRLSSILSLAGGKIPLPYNILQFFKVFRDCFLGNKTITFIHTRFYPLGLLGVLMGKLTGSQVLVVDHSSGYVEFESAALSKVSKIYDHILTFIIKLFMPKFYGVSQACNEWIKNFGITASGVCYNGIDYSEQIVNRIDIKKRHNIGKYIIYIGRLIKEKGVIELIDGFEEFAKEYSDFNLIIAGSGPLESVITQRAKDNSKIIFTGRITPDEVLNYFTDSWVFVNPSNYPEGLPTVLLEAGKCGTAVISTPNGGAKEIVINHKTGILIERGEANLIKNALVELAQNPELRENMAKDLQNLVKDKFDWKIITKEFIFNTLKLK
jgi:glycosyltransferase involved in cell wall biosynthesis